MTFKSFLEWCRVLSREALPGCDEVISYNMRNETPLPISLARCLPTPTGLVRFRCPSTKLLASSFRSQTTIELSSPALRLAPSPIPRVFLITATPLNLHKRFLTGGFLQTAVSNAPRTTSGTYLPTFLEWGASDTALAFLDNQSVHSVALFFDSCLCSCATSQKQRLTV